MGFRNRQIGMIVVVAIRRDVTDPVSGIQVNKGLLVGVALDSRVTLTLFKGGMSAA